MGTRFALSDYFTRHLTRHDVEAKEVVANSDLLQKAWARKHDVASGNQRPKAGAGKSRCPSFLFPAWTSLKAFLRRQAVRAAAR